MTRAEITTISQASEYIQTLTDTTRLVILAGHAQFISFFLNQHIDRNAALAQVQPTDAEQLQLIGKEFSVTEKTLLLYALCLEKLYELSRQNGALEKLVAQWPQGYQMMLSYCQDLIMIGEVEMTDQERGFLQTQGVEIEDDLAAMSEPDFVVVPEGGEIKLELFAAHFLAIILKLDTEILVEL